MRTIIECPGCSKPVWIRTFMCPNCNLILKDHESLKSKRNLRVVELAATGKYTLQRLADTFHVSRERIRQIYKRYTGKRFQERLALDHAKIVKRKELEAAEKELHKKDIIFYCFNCHSPVSREERKGGTRKFCKKCQELYRGDGRDLSITKLCKGCGTPFHPFRSAGYPNSNKSKGIFHSKDCYQESRDFMGGYTLSGRKKT